VPKVLDFGVSKLYEPGRQQLTALGMTMGTPYYMAPEQMTDSASVDVRADVFSIGVMLYEALSGALPYPGESVLEIFNRTKEGRPTPIRALRPDVPPSLEALLASALCPDRNARPADVRTMRERLAVIPFDGSDYSHDWSDVSEPWMLVSGGPEPEIAPLESAPTKVASTESIDQSELPSRSNLLTARTVEMPPVQLLQKQAPPSRNKVLLLVAAGVGAFLLATVTFSLVLWALFTFGGG
jgi:serine/threonine protein kinase